MIKLLCLRFVRIKYLFNFDLRPRSNVLLSQSLIHFLLTSKKFQMKRFYSLMLAVAVGVSFRAVGQSTLTLVDNANINSNCNGYLLILPQGYNPAAATTYPTIFFFMGINSTGPGTTGSLQSLITSSPANPPSQPNPQIGN